MRDSGYSSQQRVDDILDKISKYGIDSLRSDELEFLNSHKIGKQEEAHNKMIINDIKMIFEDDGGYFKFEYTYSEQYDDELHHIGIIYVPDIITGGKRVEGRLEGRIIVYPNGSVSLEFYSNDDDCYDIFEFCSGFEYELDTFIDYIVSELDSEKK